MFTRERGRMLSGVLGWQSRSVWHRVGSPEHNTDERDDSFFLLVGRLAAGAFAPRRQVASLVGNLAAKPDLSGKRDRLLQRIDGERSSCALRNEASHREVL